MDANTGRGLIYLVLILGSGVGLWIVILYRILSGVRRANAALQTENDRLKRQLHDVKVRIETRSLSDDALLQDVADLVSGL